MKKALIGALIVIALAAAGGGYWVWTTHPEWIDDAVEAVEELGDSIGIDLSSGPPPATEEEAARIKAAIETQIERLIPEGGAFASLKLDGEIEVAPDGTGYRFVIPASGLTVGEIAKGRIGRAEGRLDPTEEGLYRMTWTSQPSEVELYADRYDWEEDIRVWTKTGTLSIAGDQGSGVIDRETALMLEVDQQIGAIRFVPDEPGDPTLSFAGLSIRQDSTQTAPGIYDVDSVFSLKTLTSTIPDGTVVGSFDELKLTSAMKQMDPVALIAFYSDLFGKLGSLPEAELNGKAGEVFASMGEMFTEVPTLYDATESRIEITNLEFRPRVGFMAPVEQPVIRLDRLAFGTAATGLSSEKSRVGLNVSYDGLSLNILPPDFAPLLPRSGLIDVALVDVPADKLLRLYAGFFKGLAVDEYRAEEAAKAGFLDLVLNGGAHLEVASVKFDSEAASLDLKGAVRPEPASPWKTSSELVLVAGGMDEVIEAVASTVGGGGPVVLLTLLQSMGAEATDAKGRTARRFEFAATPDGQLTLNGTDLGPLLGSL